ncbi:MAG: hypothetical protein WCS51_02465 [Bacilli bacterium]
MNLLISTFAIGLLSTNILPLAEVNNTVIESASIENTNVSYDLSLFSNEGEYDYSYDWQKDNKVNLDVYGNPINSNYSDFKFLIVKPVIGDVYLYAYWRNPNDTLPMFKNAIVDISMSTTKDENGAYIEDINSYDAILVNSYGTKDVFLKYKISDVYDVESDTSYRILIDNLYIEYMYQGVNFNSETYSCGEYIIFQTNEDEDLVYDYWRKDYVSIESGQVCGYIVPTGLDDKEYNEYFYYFFNTDDNHPIDYLIDVNYSYELMNYNCYESYDVPFRSTIISKCYTGLFESDIDRLYDVDVNLHYVDLDFDIDTMNFEYDYSALSIDAYVNNLVANGTSTIDVERPLLDWFPYWAKQSVSYSFDNIQDLSKVEDISDSLEYATYKDFMTSDSAFDEDGNPYQWAFRVGVDDLTRSVVSTTSDAYNFFSPNVWHDNMVSRDRITSNCNEVKQTMVTHLTYFNDNKYYSLDVLDTPKEVVSISVGVVEYDDLVDKIFTSTKSFMELLKSLISNFKIIFSVMIILLTTIVVLSVVSKFRLFFLPGKVSKLKKQNSKKQ